MKAGIFPWISILVAVASTTACFNPKVPEGVACSTEGECPAGQTCDPVDNRCYSVLPDRDRDGSVDPPPDGPPRADGSVDPPDAAVAPADAAVDAGGCRGDQDCDSGQRCNLDTGECVQPPPSCQNQTRDGDETDEDCGGPDCRACSPGDTCMIARDCTSSVCGGNLQCAAPQCGDGVVNQVTEGCDDGPANSDSTPDACRTSCQPASCGDGVLDSEEEVDPPASESTTVPVLTDTCRYDFSAMRQLSCNSACGTPWNGFSGCQREDADALCKLITGNPDSTVLDASSFAIEQVRAAPGICCPPPTAAPGTLGCVSLGRMDERGLPFVVSVHDTNMSATHGTGAVVTVQSPAACTP
jgi:hypothetical protein